VKKLLSVIVAAGFLAGLGCGDSTAPKKEKDTGKTGTPPSGGAPKDKDAGGKMKDNGK